MKIHTNCRLPVLLTQKDIKFIHDLSGLETDSILHLSINVQTIDSELQRHANIVL